MDAFAIIPARGGSKRFPRKNIADLDGQPLLTYPLKAAQDSAVFSRVFISTEDKEITEIAQKAGAETHRRKDEFATDTAHELDACLNLLDDLAENGEATPEYICVIYPTAVLVQPDDFVQSKAVLEENSDTHVIMCVSGFNYHPYKALVTNDAGYLEMLYPKEGRERSQTYPHMVASNGTFYWLHVETLQNNRHKGYYQDNLKSYEIPYQRAVDIDYPKDLDYAALMMKMKEQE